MWLNFHHNSHIPRYQSKLMFGWWILNWTLEIFWLWTEFNPFLFVLICCYLLLFYWIASYLVLPSGHAGCYTCPQFEAVDGCEAKISLFGQRLTSTWHW